MTNAAVVADVVAVGLVVFWGQDLTGPTEEAPALNDHHYILILIGYDMRDSLEALPIQAYI